MITREISSKTEQLVVSPRHKPNNEQLKLCSDIFSCFIIIYCLVAKKKWFEFNKHPPRISAHPEGPKIK